MEEPLEDEDLLVHVHMMIIMEELRRQETDHLHEDDIKDTQSI
jgi:hypothetical protein